MEQGRSALKILTGKPAGKRPLGSHRPRWKDNIKIFPKQRRVYKRNYIDSVHLVIIGERFTEPPGSIIHGVFIP
jgi:hypothetical protein